MKSSIKYDSYGEYQIHVKKSGQKIKKYKAICICCGADRGYKSKNKIYLKCRDCVNSDTEFKEKLSKAIKKARNTPESIAKTIKQMEEQHRENRILKDKEKQYRINNPNWWCTKEWKQKISNSLMKHVPNNKGIPASEEQRIKQSCSIRNINIKEFNGFSKCSIEYKLKHRLRCRLWQALKNNHKIGSAVKDLGCSIEYLKEYLELQFEDGMSWNNYGRNGWEIDHIQPLSVFDLTNPEELKKACHYTNLQPLWKIDNIIKSNK